jgi:hypothetical protein
MTFWLDWNGLTHILVNTRRHTVCWINATVNYDDAPSIPTCLECVAWEQRMRNMEVP